MISLKDMDINKRGNFFGLFVTAVFFLIFIILCIFLKLKPRQEFKEITIHLDSIPVVKEKKTQVKKPEPVEKVQEKKVQKETKKQPEKQETPKETKAEKKTEKKAEKKTEAKSAKPEKKAAAKTEKNTAGAKKQAAESASKAKAEEPEIHKSIEELAAANSKPKKKQISEADFDSHFADDAEPVAVKETPAANKNAVVKSSLSGSSASAAENSSAAASGSSSAKKSDNSLSEATKNALSDIKNTAFSSSSAAGVTSKAVIASSSSNGVVSMKMSDGSSRQLISPKNPVIKISDSNAKLIDSTKYVVISFTVKADGSVPLSGILIKPESAIPAEVQSEIKEQIKSWLFSQDDSEAKASFNYSLEIK